MNEHARHNSEEFWEMGQVFDSDGHLTDAAFEALLEGRPLPVGEAHLSGCATCRETLHSLQLAHTVLLSPPWRKAPPGFQERVMAALPGAKPFWQRWPFILAVLLVGGSIAFAGISLAGILIWHVLDTPNLALVFLTAGRVFINVCAMALDVVITAIQVLILSPWVPRASIVIGIAAVLWMLLIWHYRRRTLMTYQAS